MLTFIPSGHKLTRNQFIIRHEIDIFGFANLTMPHKINLDIESYSEILEDPRKFLGIIRDIQKSLKIFICSCRSSKILEGPGDPQRFSKILRDLRRSSKTFRVLLRSFKIFEDPQRYLEILRDT